AVRIIDIGPRAAGEWIGRVRQVGNAVHGREGDHDLAGGWRGELPHELAGYAKEDVGGRHTVHEQIRWVHSRHGFAKDHFDGIEPLHGSAWSGKPGLHHGWSSIDLSC